MRSKCAVHVLSVELKDPSTTKGLSDVLKNYVPYVSLESDSPDVRRKVLVHGKLFLNTFTLTVN